MKTDNSNIVVQESFEYAAYNWCKNNDWLAAYIHAKKYGNAMFEAGANWKKEQLQPLLESHAELLAALNEVLAYEKRGADKGEPRIGNGILSIIHKAIKKANNINH